MSSKKGFEMTISTVIILILALVMLGIGLFVTYKYILKPSEATGTIITCEARGGQVVSGPADCVGGVYIRLSSETSKEPVPCCIRELK